MLLFAGQEIHPEFYGKNLAKFLRCDKLYVILLGNLNRYFADNVSHENYMYCRKRIRELDHYEEI